MEKRLVLVKYAKLQATFWRFGRLGLQRELGKHSRLEESKVGRNHKMSALIWLDQRTGIHIMSK